MFRIDSDMTIYITRGDIAYFTVTAEDNGVQYKFQPGDVVRIKVFAKKDASKVVFQKDFVVFEESEKVDILLTEKETKIGDVISKPVDYWYEIELNPFTNPQTIIGYDDDGAKIFKLYPEGRDLTYVEEEDIPLVDKELDLTSERPVQNQAIARALIGYEGRVAQATDKISAIAAQTEAEVELFMTNIVNETKEGIITERDLALEKVQDASADAEANAIRAEEAASHAEAIVGADISGIINGTTPVGDSNKLGGKGASEYASAQSVANIENGTTVVPKAANANTVGGLPVSDSSGKHGLAFINTDYGVLEIGQIIDFHTEEGQDFKARLAVNYLGDLYLTKATGESYKVGTMADLANYLSKYGGVLDTFLGVQAGYGMIYGDDKFILLESRTNPETTALSRSLLVVNSNVDATLQSALRLRDIASDGSQVDYSVHHDGNSAKVVVSSTPLTAEGSVRVW